MDQGPKLSPIERATQSFSKFPTELRVDLAESELSGFLGDRDNRKTVDDLVEAYVDAAEEFFGIVGELAAATAVGRGKGASSYVSKLVGRYEPTCTRMFELLRTLLVNSTPRQRALFVLLAHQSQTVFEMSVTAGPFANAAAEGSAADHASPAKTVLDSIKNAIKEFIGGDADDDRSSMGGKLWTRSPDPSLRLGWFKKVLKVLLDAINEILSIAFGL